MQEGTLLGAGHGSVYCESWLGAGFIEGTHPGQLDWLEPSPYKLAVAPRLLTCRAHDAIVRAARVCSIDSPPASACIAFQHEVTMPAAQCDDLESPHPRLNPLAITSGPQPQQSIYLRSMPAHTMYQNTAAISSDGRLVVLQRASHAKSATGTNPSGGVLACCCADGQSHADAGCCRHNHTQNITTHAFISSTVLGFRRSTCGDHFRVSSGSGPDTTSIAHTLVYSIVCCSSGVRIATVGHLGRVLGWQQAPDLL